MTKRQFPRALVGSTVGTTLISLAAVWLMTSNAFAPVVAVPGTARIEHSKPYQPSSRPLYPLGGGAHHAESLQDIARRCHRTIDIDAPTGVLDDYHLKTFAMRILG